MKKIIKKKPYILFLAPSFIGILIFVLIPFLDVFGRSFTINVSSRFNGIENYKLIFQSEAFLLAVKNTLRFTGICIPILVVLGLCVALPLSSIKQAQMIKSLYLLPLAMPTATIVLVWKMVFDKQGFLNFFATKIGELTGWFDGIIQIDYLGTKAAFWVLVGSYVWKNMGYTVVLWMAGIWGISKEILEAAKVDGASRMQYFFRIMLPNLKGSLYIIVVLSFLNSFKIYREAYLVAGPYPEESIYLLQHLFNNWYVTLDLDKMAAAVVCTGTFLFLLIILLQRLWDKA